MKNALAKFEGDCKMYEKRIIDLSTDRNTLKERKRKLAKRVFFLEGEVKSWEEKSKALQGRVDNLHKESAKLVDEGTFYKALKDALSGNNCRCCRNIKA